VYRQVWSANRPEISHGSKPANSLGTEQGVDLFSVPPLGGMGTPATGPAVSAAGNLPPAAPSIIPRPPSARGGLNDYPQAPSVRSADPSAEGAPLVPASARGGERSEGPRGCALRDSSRNDQQYRTRVAISIPSAINLTSPPSARRLSGFPCLRP